jgi:hypothetical protein
VNWNRNWCITSIKLSFLNDLNVFELNWLMKENTMDYQQHIIESPKNSDIKCFYMITKN